MNRKPNINLKVRLGKLELRNPVMAASGTFGYGDEYSGLVDISQLGAIITKTLTLEPRKGNPHPRIWELPYGMLNSIGLANIGTKEFLETKLDKVSKLGTKVIANIAGKEMEDYAELVGSLEPYRGIAGYELNVSCPNVKRAGMLFGVDAEAVYKITRLCWNRSKKTIIVKLTPNIADPSEVAKAAEEAGADAITMGNTVLGMAVDIESRKARIPFITAGYSGPGIKPINLAKLYLVRLCVNIPVIGCGGIMNYEDALEYIITGATAVQVGSATFKNPQTAEKIIRDLKKYLTKKGIKDINELVGSLKV